VLRSDQIRKQLAGLNPDQPASEADKTGIYTATMTRQVYVELLQRADELLQRGRSVILDASWNNHEHRQQARQLAQDSHTEHVEVRCLAPDQVASQRLQQRSMSASDTDETRAPRHAHTSRVDQQQAVSAATVELRCGCLCPRTRRRPRSRG
jgi:hypothetical protein